MDYKTINDSETQNDTPLIIQLQYNCYINYIHSVFTYF